MPTEVIVEVEDRPGVIADVGELLGTAGVNIRAAAGFAHGGRGYVHLIVDSADRALSVLKMGGWNVRESREVLSVTIEDRPGELGRYARRLADAGVNITALYTAGERGGDKELIVAVDDLAAARRV